MDPYLKTLCIAILNECRMEFTLFAAYKNRTSDTVSVIERHGGVL